MNDVMDKLNKWDMKIFIASDWNIDGEFVDNKKTGERVLKIRFDESSINGITLSQSNGTMVI